MRQIKNIPLKQIVEALNISTLQAKQIKDIIADKLDPLTFKSVQSWVNKCYNMPRGNELKIEAINEIIQGFGTEPVRIEGHYVNNYYFDCVASYVNLGDTYIPTVLLDNRNHKYYICSWGDFYESIVY
jgi:hypothetical protein